MPTYFTAASTASIQAGGANDIETSCGKLRLRPRPSYATANRPVIIIDGNQAPTASPDLGPVYRLLCLASHRELVPERCQTRAGSYKRFAADDQVLLARQSYGGVRISGVADLLSGSFTVDIEFSLALITNVGFVVAYRTVNGVDAGKIFDVTWNGSGVKTFTINFYKYTGVLTTYALTLDASAWVFTNLKFYDLRITFDRTNNLFKAEIRDPDTDARITATRTGATDVTNPASLDSYSEPLLTFGSLIAEGGAAGTLLASGPGLMYLQRAVVYSSFLDTGMAAIAARPTFYAALTGGDGDGVGAIMTIDSGYEGAEWDPNSLDTNDASVFAAAIGAGGWEFRYQITDNAAPSAWSAWMTWADLHLEGIGNGRYFHLGLRAQTVSDETFYPIVWISGDAELQVPDAPTLSNFTRNGVIGSVTVADVDPGITAEIWAVTKVDIDATIVWERIGTRYGSGVVNLDFSSFIQDLTPIGLGIMDICASIVGFAVNAGGMYSEPSNCLGSLLDSSAGISVTVTISGGIATFTVIGLSANAEMVIGYVNAAGTTRVTLVTGPGVHTWNDGFLSGRGYSFNCFPFGEDAKFLLLPIVATVAGPGHCRPRQALGLEERP